MELFSDRKLTQEEAEIRLLKFKSDEVLNYFFSYNAKDFVELYEYFTAMKSVCCCSMELQCAVYDANKDAYLSYVDDYLIHETMNLRVDKLFELVNEDFINELFWSNRNV